ncbi:hypothetical protein CAC42_4541 [Sphaceloma murrayae]|uniref:Rhodopsin domain-containing protein n=1 Tax=Sphaceloma murrayae TaxID=2082308 RepID=A0A2K1QMP9_9PEZI|nr:hypothetical protein CAC42_4541 [Sphaceloma murrayae]
MIAPQSAVISSYACSIVTSLILIARLFCARLQPRPFDLSFFVTLFSLVIVIIRAIVSKYALHYGTINDYKFVDPTPDVIEHIRIGTILTLTLRILLTTILWAMCALLLLLYRRFVSHLPWMKRAISATWIFMGASYLAVVLAIFFECHPLSKFWQFSPPPGQCTKALVQVSLQCAGNMAIDVVLIALSVPVLFIKGTSSSQRLKLGTLFSMGVFCIIVNGLRLYYTFVQGSAQPARTFWASIAIAVSAFVANAPVIYGSIRLRKNASRFSETGSRKRTLTVEKGYELDSFRGGGEDGISRQVMVTVASGPREIV